MLALRQRRLVPWLQPRLAIDPVIVIGIKHDLKQCKSFRSILLQHDPVFQEG